MTESESESEKCKAKIEEVLEDYNCKLEGDIDAWATIISRKTGDRCNLIFD